MGGVSIVRVAFCHPIGRIASVPLAHSSLRNRGIVAAPDTNNIMLCRIGIACLLLWRHRRVGKSNRLVCLYIFLGLASVMNYPRLLLPFCFGVAAIALVVLFWWQIQGQVSCIFCGQFVSARGTVPQCVQNGSALVYGHSSLATHYLHKVLTYPLCYRTGYSVAAHFVSGGVGVLFAVCTWQGVVVGPSH